MAGHLRENLVDDRTLVGKLAADHACATIRRGAKDHAETPDAEPVKPGKVAFERAQVALLAAEPAERRAQTLPWLGGEGADEAEHLI